MAQTPDRHPGDVIIADDGIALTPQGVSPTVNGEVRYVLGLGFRFYQEGTNVGLSSGSGISESSHSALRQLIHFVDNGPAEGFASNAYRETTGTVFPTAIIWWTSVAKVSKIVEKLITYVGAFPTIIQWKMYATDGTTVIATVTDTLTYSGPFETSRVRVIA